MSFALSNIVIGSGSSNAIKDSGTSLSSLSSGYTISYGHFQRATNDGNGDASYSHSLGKTPKWIEFIALFGGTTTTALTGYYDVTNNQNYHMDGNSSTYCIKFGSTSSSLYYQQGYISATSSSSFTITWAQSGSTGGTTYYIIFKVIG